MAPSSNEIPKDASSEDLLVSATRGFDLLFCNDLTRAKEHFRGKEDPYHLLGLGACAFMEAALGMETGLLAEASKCLSLSEAGAKRQLKTATRSHSKHRFAPGLEYEILNADAVVLLGLTNALSESYMGYLQCMYSLNSAHSKFSKLYKTVFPNGLDAYETPSASPAPSRKPSTPSIRSSASSYSIASPPPTQPQAPPISKGFFSRFRASSLSVPTQTNGNGSANGGVEGPQVDGPVDNLIIAGTAFGYGLFNLVFSLLPKKVQGVVGFLGFKHDRKLALRALAVSASKNDVHSVFSGLVLMTYYGVVLLLSGYQADETHIVRQYKAIVDRVESRFPEGALWILNRAKIMRMSSDPEGAIKVLRDGLKPERPHSFAQADTLLVFELAWTLLGQRRYQESADMFIKVTELNSWSHGTYYFLAAGCYISLGNVTKAQALLDVVPDLIDKKKLSGKDLPTEVFIKKKMAFYQEKQKRRGGEPNLWAQAMKISIAEELGLFWNTHARIDPTLARAHIQEWAALTPALPLPRSSSSSSEGPSASEAEAPAPPPPPPAATGVPPPIVVPTRTNRPPAQFYGFSHDLQPMPTPAPSSSSSSSAAAVKSNSSSTSIDNTNSNGPLKSVNIVTSDTAAGPIIPGSTEGNPRNLPDIDTPDEEGIRYLLIGICQRTMGDFEGARESLKGACALQEKVKVSSWLGGVAMFELAVLDLKEVEVGERRGGTEVEVGTMTMTTKKTAEWDRATKAAVKKLDAAMALAGSAVDLSSRLDTRVSMLRDEIAAKREMLGI